MVAIANAQQFPQVMSTPALEQMPKDPKTTYDQQLMDALHFDAHDLAENREGRLTPPQRKKLEAYRNTWTVWRVIGFALAAFASGMAFAESLHALIVVIWVTFTLFYFYSRWQLRPYLIDLQEGRVRMQEGRVKLDVNHHDAVGRKNEFIVSMVNKRFNVKRPIFDAFNNAHAYRVYFAPKSQVLISAEWMRE